MATVFSDYGLDFSNLNLNRIAAGAYQNQFNDNVFWTIHGATYSDVLEIAWNYNGGSYLSTFAGTNLTFDASGNVTGGTVTGYFEGFWNGSAWILASGVQNTSMSAAALYQAGLTPSTTDDYALFQGEMAGADQVTGSPYIDVLYGYAGDDTITGGAGADIIDGGAGADTITGGAGSDTQTGGLGADTFVVGPSGDITGDTIDGTAEAGTIDTLRLNGAASYSLASTLTNLDRITFNQNAAGFNLTVTNNQVSTADANRDGIPGDLQIDAAVAMTNGVVIDGSGLTGSNRLVVVGGNLGGADTIIGGAGNDVIDGGDGNDVLRGGQGSDQVHGGLGVDTADYSTESDAATVNLLDPGQNAGSASGDTYVSIENVTGSHHDGDVLTGNEGDNVLNGLDGYNTLDGGAGNDTLIGGAGPNFIYAGYGDDTVTGGSGLNSVFGFLGNDTLTGGDSGNTMNGEDGNDTLNGGAGVDYLVGGTGADVLNGGGSGDALFGDDPSNPATGGNDTLNGGDGDDGLDGGAGDDGLNGGKGVDWMYGQTGNDQLDGGDDTDALFGGDGNDILEGGNGGDSVDGGNGDDQVFGDAGVDWLFGQAGNDTLDGFTGGDVLFGGDGNDQLNGRADGDSLDGGSGDDTLDGGAGIDVLFGNSGADVFLFSRPSDGGDVVRDFNAAEGDSVAVDSGGFGLSAGLAGQFLPDAMFESGSGLPAVFQANGPVFYLETQNHGLWFDPTGGSSGDLTIVAGFETGMPTNAHDITVL